MLGLSTLTVWRTLAHSVDPLQSTHPGLSTVMVAPGWKPAPAIFIVNWVP